MLDPIPNPTLDEFILSRGVVPRILRELAVSALVPNA